MNTTSTAASTIVFSGMMASFLLPQIATTDPSMGVPRYFAFSGSAGSNQKPVSARTDSTESLFQTLVTRWKSEFGHSVSSIDELVASPNYRLIIEMGEVAVPLIISQLKAEGDEPDHWFVALRELVGESPIRAEDRGKLRKMADAWIAWGEAKYG